MWLGNVLFRIGSNSSVVVAFHVSCLSSVFYMTSCWCCVDSLTTFKKRPGDQSQVNCWMHKILSKI